MRKVIITGASKGIGLAIAQAFAIFGDHVIICSRKKEHLENAKQSILNKAPKAKINTYVCDLSNSEQINAFTDYILTEIGGCDILVNNAGIFIPGSIHEEAEGNYDKIMQINMKSAYQITRQLLPIMIAKQSGDIVNICSIASQTPYSNGGSYSISKFAMLGFSKNLREELKPSNIRVTSVLPGAVYTDSWSEYDGPIDRLMPPEDIASMVLSACNLSRRSVVEEIIIRPQLGDL